MAGIMEVDGHVGGDVDARVDVLKNIKMENVVHRKSRNGNFFHSEMMTYVYSKFDRNSVATFGSFLIDDLAARNAANRIKTRDATQHQLRDIYQECIDKMGDDMKWSHFLSALTNPVLQHTLDTFAERLQQEVKNGIGEGTVFEIYSDLYDQIVVKIPIFDSNGARHLGLALGLDEVSVKRLSVNTTLGEKEQPSDVAMTLVTQWYQSYPEGTIFDIYKCMTRAGLPKKETDAFAEFWREEWSAST